MDDFGIDRPELTGTLISMEFGPGGRIGQMWVANPNLPDENEEFQFVLSPINMGDEIVEDYYPGTILIGARTHPDDPWIVSRNSRASQAEDDDDPGKVTFTYDFAFLDDIEAVGKFYERPGTIPQICWDLTITNKGKSTLEIGELAFPFALNNLYEGYPGTDSGMSEMFKDRVYVHKYIGGAGSYLFAQRLNAEAPGLLVFPGDETRWEFYNHVPASINSPFRWEGIPVVYIHSRAAIEREEWPEWFNEHTSLILEPGESRTYQTRFVPTERDRFDSVNPVLSACGQPAIRLLPGAVAPADVGIALEVSGATPTRFFTDGEAELETDSDDEGGFCFVKPDGPGLTTLSFEDTKGRETSTHLLFIEPIEKLIKARAKWIVDKQIHIDPKSNLHHAFLATDIHTGDQLSAIEEYLGPFGIESSLADALFLAEKNSIFPDAKEIEALEEYVTDFLLDDLQNPSDGSIGSAFADPKSVALNAGRAQIYTLAANLYTSLYRLETQGFTKLTGNLEHALRTATLAGAITAGNLEFGSALLLGELKQFVGELSDPDFAVQISQAWQTLSYAYAAASHRSFPFAGPSGWSTEAFREAFEGASSGMNPVMAEEAMRFAYAARSLSPSWWWYASDKRWLEEHEMPHPAMADKGELCLGPTTVTNSLMFFRLLERDYTSLPDSYLRLAFGGMLGIWALVRSDGAGSMGFCPDAASKQFGISALTGDVGIGLFAYLRNVASYVLPTRMAGVITFGCHFEMETLEGRDLFLIRPWDGVGRRIVVRQIGFEVRTSFGILRELRFDTRKRWAKILLHNPASRLVEAELVVKGLWGRAVEFNTERFESQNGYVQIPVSLESGTTKEIELKVIE
ncbi:MAG: hypothetical protein H7Y17_01500 [Chlorobia bacterium]|nr:hypothetical protein [Fimbriimonadaceae bacterium]